MKKMNKLNKLNLWNKISTHFFFFFFSHSPSLFSLIFKERNKFLNFFISFKQKLMFFSRLNKFRENTIRIMRNFNLFIDYFGDFHLLNLKANITFKLKFLIRIFINIKTMHKQIHRNLNFAFFKFSSREFSGNVHGF